MTSKKQINVKEANEKEKKIRKAKEERKKN